MANGTISQVIGSTFDAQFPENNLPEIYNALKIEYTVSGETIRLSKIETPTAVVTFEHDYIVPAESATVMLDKIASTEKRHIHLSGGHVGAVVSRRAATGLWPQLSTWWAEHDADGLVRSPLALA